MIDDEEIVKALSLEEKALDEFKRRKNSLPQPKTTSKSSLQGKLDNFANIQQVSKNFVIKLDSNARKRSQPPRALSVDTTREETDLISFASEIPSRASQELMIAEDPYNKIKESILRLNTPSNHQKQQQPNLQVVPYSKPQVSLSPEGLNNLYSMSTNINNYYSRTSYFQPQPSTFPTYPAIGFSHFAQQPPTYTPYATPPSYYQATQPQNYGWTPPPSVSSKSNSSSTPTQLPAPKFAALSIKAVSPVPSTSSSSERAMPTLPRPSVVGDNSPRPSTSANDNLIDFEVDDSKYEANLLQTFDPLASNRTSTDDAENTYYTDQDPFDYIYSGGTQYSDPMYEAVVRSDHSLASPKSQTPQEISEYYMASVSSEDPHDPQKPPPLPPRNLNKSNSQSESFDDGMQQNGSAPRYPKKLYENVTHLKKFDRDMEAFYTMVKELRSKYLFNDEKSNIGHIVAAELDSKYMNVTSIKLLVYPSMECFPGRFTEPYSDRSQETYQKLDGYANPIVFTCDINSTVVHVILHVLTELEEVIKGKPEDFALKTIGSQEWLSDGSSLSHLEYIQSNIKLERDIQLGLFKKDNKYMKILARTQQDDLRDAVIKFENIMPKEIVSAISYDSLMILLETLETEIDKLESEAADNSVLHPSGVVQGVKAICALLGCVDTLELFNTINNLKEACQSHSQSYQKVSRIFNHRQMTNNHFLFTAIIQSNLFKVINN